MQHNVLDTVLQAFSGASVGHSSTTVAGLWVTPILGLTPPALRAQTTIASALQWAEADPPHPGRLRARNGSRSPAAVDAGTVLVGGMADRTVRIAATVAADGWADVTVVPLGARWWDEGTPRWHGRLGPVAAALLLQAELAKGAAASSARTVMWSLSMRDLVASSDDPVLERVAAGWVLTDGHGALAAWLPKRSVLPAHTRSTAGEPRRVPDLVVSLLSGLTQGVLVGHVLEERAAGADVVVLPRGLQLVDHLVAAMTREDSG